MLYKTKQNYWRQAVPTSYYYSRIPYVIKALRFINSYRVYIGGIKDPNAKFLRKPITFVCAVAKFRRYILRTLKNTNYCGRYGNFECTKITSGEYLTIWNGRYLYLLYVNANITVLVLVVTPNQRKICIFQYHFYQIIYNNW